MVFFGEYFMFFYVDESGNTGANLFDETQPILYYGVLSCDENIDCLAVDFMKSIRTILGVNRLHASELGFSKVELIADSLVMLQEKFGLHFDLHIIKKTDYAIMSFFDQVFDQGINKAVPWLLYWTPLRFIILVKIASLFDHRTLQKAWEARVQTKETNSVTILTDVCSVLLSRINFISDDRSRNIITDSFNWVINNPTKLHYNANSKDDITWITPNIIGFESVMLGIADKIKNKSDKTPIIIVDLQTQFNRTQNLLANFYAEANNHTFDFGTGLPAIDFTGMPKSPIIFKSGGDSIGLELVDIFLWLFKKMNEGIEFSGRIKLLIDKVLPDCTYDEISLNAISNRWIKWYNELPIPTKNKLKKQKN